MTVKKKRRKFGNQPNRKMGLRGASGRLLRAYRGGGDDDTIPKEVLDRRAEEMGLPRDSDRLASADGSNLGILVERGILQAHHKDAGLKLWDLYRRWKAAIEAKPRHAKIMTIGGVSHSGKHDDTREIDWTKAKHAYTAAQDVVGLGLRWELVEAAVIEPASIFDLAPRLFEDSVLGDRCRVQLVAGMNSLCKYFGISPKDTA